MLVVDSEEGAFDVRETTPGDGTRMDVEELEDGRRRDKVRMRGNVVEDGLEHVNAFGDGRLGLDDVLVGEGRESRVEGVNSRISQDLLIEGVKVIVTLQRIDNGGRRPLAHVGFDVD